MAETWLLEGWLVDYRIMWNLCEMPINWHQLKCLKSIAIEMVFRDHCWESTFLPVPEGPDHLSRDNLNRIRLQGISTERILKVGDGWSFANQGLVGFSKNLKSALVILSRHKTMAAKVSSELQSSLLAQDVSGNSPHFYHRESRRPEFGPPLHLFLPQATLLYTESNNNANDNGLYSHLAKRDF